MTAQNLSDGRAERLIVVLGFTFALGYLISLTGSWLQGEFLYDAHGQSIVNDFVNVWAAGDLALHGRAADAYDWTLHKAAEVRAAGHDFKNYYGWHYPPTFFFAAILVTLAPYPLAVLPWLVATLAGYAVAIRSILASNAGIFLALGFPSVLWNAAAGQNGYLSAALVAGTLSQLDRRPALAGLWLGLLTYKPHFGLLFPVALIAGARWRVIAVASAVAAAMAALSLAVFGRASWQAFVDWMPVTTRVVMDEGAADWRRLESLFGLVRVLGGSATLAWSVQAAAALALAALIAWLWRSRAAYEIKAAGLSCAALLATPYIYTYDQVMLAVPVAFLVRLALARGFFASEIAGLAVAAVILLTTPWGLAATVIVGALTVQRHIAERKQ